MILTPAPMNLELTVCDKTTRYPAMMATHALLTPAVQADVFPRLLTAVTVIPAPQTPARAVNARILRFHAMMATSAQRTHAARWVAFPFLWTAMTVTHAQAIHA
jgi:hypothetical protein